MPPFNPLPPRSQPLVALILACLLGAAGLWFATAGGLSGRLVDHDAPPAVDHAFTIDVNTAGEAEMAQLPGLGPVTARRIVDWRRDHGPFRSLDELLDVTGIGSATWAAMRPHLRPIEPAAPPAAPPPASTPTPP
jgi:competence ComEA-like helix-hairpin-helix protein